MILNPIQMKSIINLAILVLISTSCIGQVNDRAKRLKVLEEAIIGKKYVFGKWNVEGGEETHLVYLGEIKSGERKLKVLTSIWYWGLSKRATNRVLIYNSDNQYLGQYILGNTCEIPKRLENGHLVFSHDECSECDKSNELKLNLNNILPKKFFWECKNGLGDLFYFSS